MHALHVVACWKGKRIYMKIYIECIDVKRIMIWNTWNVGKWSNTRLYKRGDGGQGTLDNIHTRFLKIQDGLENFNKAHKFHRDLYQ